MHALKTIETDYLVIGAGASGMAFADTMLDESDARITLVDRHAKPGGHWNDAYPFVTLHQPSAFYGVNSLELGHRRKDTVGLNQGLYELASGAEINAYYERVMNHRLLPSGRVDFHPLCQVLADGSIESLVSGERTRVVVRKKVVDAHYQGPTVPSRHRPRFAMAPGVQLVPPNALPQLWLAPGAAPSTAPQRFVVLGAGKTAMDACVWLLQAGVNPDAIQWVVPRDAWLVNRVTTQPAAEFFHQAIGGQADQMQALAEATSVDDLYLRLEACGMLMRLHPERTPTMFHLATLSPGEAALLRRIHQVIRLGRVRALEPQRMVLDQGQVPVTAGTVFVDCTASAVEPRPTQPIFQDGRIVLQIVRLPQPTFSAALIAWVETHGSSDKHKNALCAPVPFPHRLQDYPRSMMVSMWNQFQWGQDKVLRQWIRASRLDGFGKLMAEVDPQDADKQAVLARFKATAQAAMANAQRLAAAEQRA